MVDGQKPTPYRPFLQPKSIFSLFVVDHDVKIRVVAGVRTPASTTATLFLQFISSRWSRVTGCSTVRMSTGTITSSSPRAMGDIVHLNHAGASPSPPSVFERVVEHMELERSVGGYAAIDGDKFHDPHQELAEVYDRVGKLVSAESPQTEIALVESATVAWTRLFYAFAQHQDRRATKQKKTKVILVSQVEYAANLVAACRWARTHPNWTVRMIPSTFDNASGKGNTGVVDVQVLRETLAAMEKNGEEQAAIVCVTHIPTNSGVVNPVEEIGNVVGEHNSKLEEAQRQPPSDGNVPSSIFPNALYLVDACQSVGQRPVDVRKIRCHGLVATGRKYLRAPRGTGFLYVNERLLDGDSAEQLWPDHPDHFATPVSCVPVIVLDDQRKKTRGFDVQDVLSFRPRPGARRFEFWEASVANKLGLGQAVAFALDMGVKDAIFPSIRSLVQHLCDRLREIDRVTVLHDAPSPQCGLVTFWVTDVDSALISDQLWEKGGDGVRIEVSVVPRTSTPLDSALAVSGGVPDLVRASVSYTNTLEDLHLFCDRLSSILGQEKTES